MKVIIECKNLEEYKVAIENYGINNYYPVISGISTNKLYDVLKSQNIEYSVKEFNNELKSKFDINNLCNDLNKGNKNNVIFVFGDKEDYIWAAYYQAKLTNSYIYILKNESELINRIKCTKFKFVTVISEHKLITVKLISLISEIQMNRLNNKEFYVGFLTARDIYGLTGLIIKNHIYNEDNLYKALTINRLDYNNKEILSSENVDVYPVSMTDVKFIEDDLKAKNRSFLTMIGHGRDDIYWLNNGAICGQACYYNRSNENSNKGKPSCFYTGKCFKRGMKVFHAYDVASRNVFVNSCYSSKIEEGLFSDNFNLVFAFLDGYSVSYLGSSFMVNGKEYMNYYYIAQAMSGIELGVISSNISKIYLDYGLGHPLSYFLIGDPRSKIKENIAKVEIDISKNQNNEYHVYYDIDKDVYLISLKFDNKDVNKKFLSNEYKLEIKSNNKDLYAVFRETEENVFLDIFSSTIISQGSLEVNFTKYYAIDKLAIRNFESMLGIGICPSSKFKAILTETKDVAINMAKTNITQISDLRKMNNFYKKIDKLNNRVLSLSETMVNYLVEQVHTKGYTWDDQCLSNGLQYKKYKNNNTDRCINCNRELYEIDYQHEFYKELYRKYYCCSACGITKDVPNNIKGVDIEVKGNSVVCAGDSIEQTLIIKNNTNNVLYGFAGMSIASGKDENITYEDGYTVEKVLLNNDESIEITSKINFPKESIPHNYWLYSNIILNGEVWVIKKDIWIVPSK